jgi:hypothetical protein
MWKSSRMSPTDTQRIAHSSGAAIGERSASFKRFERFIIVQNYNLYSHRQIFSKRQTNQILIMINWSAQSKQQIAFSGNMIVFRCISLHICIKALNVIFTCRHINETKRQTEDRVRIFEIFNDIEYLPVCSAIDYWIMWSNVSRSWYRVNVRMSPKSMRSISTVTWRRVNECYSLFICSTTFLR